MNKQTDLPRKWVQQPELAHLSTSRVPKETISLPETDKWQIQSDLCAAKSRFGLILCRSKSGFLARVEFQGLN